jgi:hypothetical protein
MVEVRRACRKDAGIQSGSQNPTLSASSDGAPESEWFPTVADCCGRSAAFIEFSILAILRDNRALILMEVPEKLGRAHLNVRAE